MIKVVDDRILVDVEFDDIRQVKIHLNGAEVFNKEFGPETSRVQVDVKVTFREDGNFIEADCYALKGVKHAVLGWNDKA
jgi:hypothetical protein